MRESACPSSVPTTVALQGTTSTTAPDPCRINCVPFVWSQSDKEHEEKINEQREKQRRLITQLKSQLEDLETYAYEVSPPDEGR